MNDTCLVTGVAGFLGSHVAESLLAKGREVIGVDDLSGGFRRNVPVGTTFCEGSVLDAALLSQLFERHKPKFVFHLAAYAAEVLSHHIRRFNYTNNVLGSVELINLAVAHDVCCFVFTSSIAVYGSATPPMRESMVPAPEDPYGIAKLAVELDLQAANRKFGLPYVIFRPHNVYGERQNLSDPYRNVVGIFLRSLLLDEPMPIYGSGDQVRAFSYIDEVAPIIAASIEQPSHWNDVYNVGGGGPVTINALAQQIAQVLGRDPVVRHLPERTEVFAAFADHTKLHRTFGKPEGIGLQEGLARTARWARTITIRAPARWDEIELPVDLPTAWEAKHGS